VIVLAVNKNTRWRGFNLLGLFVSGSKGEFNEEYFKWISDWGFNFVRFPMSYRKWIEGEDVYKIKESTLETIDRAIELGNKYNLHVSLNFHRAPGYCINHDLDEPFNLWKDKEALDAFCYHWELFSKRYKGISSDKLSFDLVNEPPNVKPEVMTRGDYERVVRAAVNAIRNIDNDRLIIAEGVDVGNTPCPELADLKIGQSCRGYIPFSISHYKAKWVPVDWDEPVWPNGMNFDGPWDKAKLEAHYSKWAELSKKGVLVHCGEFGAYNKTPHAVVLAWLRDVLDILKAYDIGFSLWEFDGEFGILNSGRLDVNYEDWHGHKLDRELLNLLQEF
jgi:endoglucanase